MLAKAGANSLLGAVSPTPTLLWFRHDLRLQDNPALHAALTRGAPVIPLYIWDEAGSGRTGQSASPRGPVRNADGCDASLGSRHPAYANAPAVFYAQQVRCASALFGAEALRQLQPGKTQAEQLAQRLCAESCAVEATGSLAVASSRATHHGFGRRWATFVRTSATLPGCRQPPAAVVQRPARRKRTAKFCCATA